MKRLPSPGALSTRHAAPVGLDDVPHQGQPDAAAPPALRLAPPDAVELLEDPRLLGGRDADALVGHRDAPAVAVRGGASTRSAVARPST